MAFAPRLILAFAAILSTSDAYNFVGKGCTAVPKNQCGSDWGDSCLKCGSGSAYDCEECCPGCSAVSKGNYRFCECKKPPGPPPIPSGGDSWQNYSVGGLEVLSVTGGHHKDDYDKVVIMLHGGGGSGYDWEYQYEQGWFGNLTGFKYVFPTSAIDSHVWYVSHKNGCGLADDCAYDIASIQDSAARVAALIEHERGLLGGDATKVFLAGFSQGAQMTSYIQLAKLDYALGGVIVMDGFPLPPLSDMASATPAAAKKNATYFGADMRWMIWQGGADPIFPANLTMSYYHNIFRVLGISTTLRVDHVEPGMSHTLIRAEFDRMAAFVRGN